MSPDVQREVRNYCLLRIKIASLDKLVTCNLELEVAWAWDWDTEVTEPTFISLLVGICYSVKTTTENLKLCR